MLRCTLPVFILAIQLMGAEARDLHLEYRKNEGGVYEAYLRNRRSAPVTAYLADASYDDNGRERHTALGGDTLGFTNGEDQPVPAEAEVDAGRSLPRHAVPGATRVLAAIYADGATDGEDDVVAMLLAGRHRAYADLKEAIAELEKGSSPSLPAFFEHMQEKDQSDSAELDDIEDAPGRMRYRFFVTAVPTAGLQTLQSGGTAESLLARFRAWRQKLAESKPDIR